LKVNRWSPSHSRTDEVAPSGYSNKTQERSRTSTAWKEKPSQ
jgi:hypothetical protein